MSLLVDYREGSKNLIEPLRTKGLPVERSDLPAGDVVFVGRGEKGSETLVGIEYKLLGDLIDSLRTERLTGHQLLAMQDEGIQFKYLLIEGELNWGKDGILVKKGKYGDWRPYHGAMTIGELLKRVNVLHLRGGLNPIWAHEFDISVAQIEMLYRTWTDVDLDKHKSHLGIYVPPLIARPSQFMSTTITLPHCGRKVAHAAQQVFGSIRRAINASAAEWAAVETLDDNGKRRRFGLTYGTELVDAVMRNES